MPIVFYLEYNHSGITDSTIHLQISGKDDSDIVLVCRGVTLRTSSLFALYPLHDTTGNGNNAMKVYKEVKAHIL